jgi:hypothetical protein
MSERFRIHYEIDDFEDSIIIEGETVREVQRKAHDELQRRGLDPERNNAWSERMEASDDSV